MSLCTVRKVSLLMPEIPFYIIGAAPEGMGKQNHRGTRYILYNRAFHRYTALSITDDIPHLTDEVELGDHGSLPEGEVMLVAGAARHAAVLNTSVN